MLKRFFQCRATLCVGLLFITSPCSWAEQELVLYCVIENFVMAAESNTIAGPYNQSQKAKITIRIGNKMSVFRDGETTEYDLLERGGNPVVGQLKNTMLPDLWDLETWVLFRKKDATYRFLNTYQGFNADLLANNGACTAF